MKRWMAFGLAALPVLAGGCAKKEPKVLRAQFREALESYYFDLNREMAHERNPEPPAEGAPIVHEYVINPEAFPRTRYPEPDEEHMPAAKRKAVDPTTDKPDETVEGSYEADVHYLVITYKREEQKLRIPVEPVDPLLKPEMISLKDEDAIRAVYLPIVYRWGKQHFVFHRGRLIAERIPHEEPLTEQERAEVIRPSRKGRESAP
jgi:hypothetical protein